MDPTLLKRNSYLQPSVRRKPAFPTVTFSRIVYGIISLLWISYFLLLKHDYDHPVTAVNRCEQPKPAAPPSNLSGFTDAPGFAEDSARRLAGAVKIPTMSFDDMGPVDKDTRWAPFKEMHSYLRTTFPTVHTSLDLTVVGGYSLVYTWPGSVKDSKPLMLTAHLDVVPSLTALDRWTYPPFAGIIDGDWIYGRGSGDCKNNLIGILTAVEHLVSSGWKPQRTIILAFGQDEEISGPRGANNIGKYLEEKYGKNGIGMIVDEGGMNIETAYGTEFALPGIAEKGYLNAIIEVDMLGGHSSIPPPHTSIGILSKIVTAIEDSPVFQPHIETASPIWGYLSCVSQHGKSNLVPDWIRKGIQSKKPKMNKIAKKFAEMSVGNRYLLQTSKAPTIFNAGLKSNALAESASVLFNSRIDLFSSPAKVREEYRNLIRPVAEKYSLLFEGAAVSAPPYIGNITVNWKDPHEPSPISPFQIDSPAWLIFSRAVQASFGADVITAPSAMTGNTDTRYYWNLSKNIYRWSPTRAGTKLNIHTVDEKIKIKTHVEGIKFYTELILQSDGMAHIQVD
ncbi:hypothetical protein GALMADRAFT_262764 [Galerina marginata CBS 339.88]|uniref:Peptidase M20 dimerisation domain-containing protein n=1 Tax=Galerina marginata (strain CBS 339.88) TaxID=685588 RepID=A0A067TZR0_GALM3|nr:hypothetical protein GALMADRAFT_262764 [Galerina marginata CBS 339.88]